MGEGDDLDAEDDVVVDTTDEDKLLVVIDEEAGGLEDEGADAGDGLAGGMDLVGGTIIEDVVGRTTLDDELCKTGGGADVERVVTLVSCLL